MRQTLLAFVFVVLALPRPANAGPFVDVGFGGAWSANTKLTIEQAGQPAITIENAHYATRPFEPPIYYRVRAGWRLGANALRVEFIHHKLYLDNPPPDVQHFEVTHGYNLLLLSLDREWTLLPGFVFLTSYVGGGAVLAHTESTVRGVSHQPAHQEWAGGAFQAGGGVKLKPLPLLVLGVELAGTAAWANVEVADGTANVPNLALHMFFVVGVEIF